MFEMIGQLLTVDWQLAEREELVALLERCLPILSLPLVLAISMLFARLLPSC